MAKWVAEDRERFFQGQRITPLSKSNHPDVAPFALREDRLDYGGEQRSATHLSNFLLYKENYHGYRPGRYHDPAGRDRPS